MNEEMKADFNKWVESRYMHPDLVLRHGYAWDAWQAALSQQEQLYDACNKAKADLSEFAKVAKASGLNVPASWEFHAAQHPSQSTMLRKPTAKESLTVHAQPSCEPVAWRLDWPVEISLGSPRFAGRDNPEYKDRMVLLGATAIPLYAATPDYEVIRAENAQLKETIKAHEDAFTESLSDTLELIAERDKLQQLLMTALDTGRAAIAERDALKERNDELVGEITKALSFVECSHRPPVKDSLENGRMVYIRLHALADLHAIIRKESK